jgi:predicted metal-dependent hydrolase
MTGTAGEPGDSAETVKAVEAGGVAAPRVEVRRSRRRRRTVSARREGEAILVLVPATMTAAQEREWVPRMVARVLRAEARRRTPLTDVELAARAARLSDRYLGGLARPESVRWVDNQRSRWGSCTPGDRTIRLSSRLRTMPAWVVDYVLVHELAHLLEPAHDERFWGWVEHYPQAGRAQGYLLGWSAAHEMDPPPGEDEPLPDSL